MKRILSLATIVLAVSTFSASADTALAQQTVPVIKHGNSHGDPHKAATKMSRKLGLSPEQTAKIEPILADRHARMQSLRADTSLTDVQRKQQRRTIAQSTRLQMGNVLSADQMKQLKALHREKAREKAAVPAV